MAKYIQGIFIALFLLVSGNIAAQTTYYVTFDGKPVADGWQTDEANNKVVTTLEDALSKAVAKDEIWIQGWEKADVEKVYVVPKEGYTVKSGVSIYGGFHGTEDSKDKRETVDGKQYRMKYRTVLTGDKDRNDKTTGQDFIFPGSTENNRDDNATHVLVLDMNPAQASGNNNTEPTIINGLTIARGHASGTDNAGKGGGILITGDNTNGGVFKIEQCFFLGNYASLGGAIYVDEKVKTRADRNRINRCAFFNNAAGERTNPSNSGAGIYIAGDATVVNSVVFNNANGGINASGHTTDDSNAAVVNSTVTRNSGSGIDGKYAKVYNTVVWGNTALYTGTDSPDFNYSAYPEASEAGGTDGKGNIYLSEKNNDTNEKNEIIGPAFSSPSLKTGFDNSFIVYYTMYPEYDWEPQGETTLVDKGNNDYYYKEDGTTELGTVDMGGYNRLRGEKIDIGAYEFQPVSTDRIRYVKEGATGDGTSWANASGDLKKMIDELADAKDADGNDQAGEVWVAGGTYLANKFVDTENNSDYTSSFRMRNKISVYGGFAGTEEKKSERAKGTSGMPWDFVSKTILQGLDYDETKLEYANNAWTNTTSSSRHVVWFAPLDGESAFDEMTYLDGVTVRGGYADGKDDIKFPFATDRGAGIYMVGDNVSVTNCIITENSATGNGGGVYMNGGRVRTSLIYNNNAGGDGGAVYADGAALIHRSMLANNSADNGAGAYLKAGTYDGAEHPEYLIMSTCVVSNNTSRTNGAVYCDNGGVLLQNTITNNFCPKATDNADQNASQTGGLYIDGYALLVNSVLWNNRYGSTNPVDATDVPMYAKNPDASKVRFIYNAVSGGGNAVWNSTLQQQTLNLAGSNSGSTSGTVPNFTTTGQMATGIDTKIGVQGDWTTGIDYYWEPVTGSALWSSGLELGQFPSVVMIQPEIDIKGNLYSQKPTIGAFHVENTALKPSEEKDEQGDDLLVLYVDADNQDVDADGSSWEKAYRSLNGAVSYFAGLSEDEVAGKQLEVRVLEGDLWPRYAYVNEDVKSATLDLAKTNTTLRIKGGYYRDESGVAKNENRDPLNHRSILNGNRDGKDLAEGNYHVVTVEAGAKVEIDGFHIINGYAAGENTIQYGAGLLAYEGADVTLLNCIFENNTAVTGAAIGAPDATVKMYNCVVNNNTNTTETAYVISANNLTMEHVTVVNNIGAAPAEMGTSSFSAGNSSGINTFDIATTSTDGAKNFSNPTNTVGATMGFDTYLGGYSVFCPLTSSPSSDVTEKIINAAPTSGLPTDITVLNDRNLGGVPDLGAYEADLPKSGRVYYVRTDGDDNNDGTSWSKAFATIRKAVTTAYNGEVVNGEKPQVWVAAGTYSQAPQNELSLTNSDNCFLIHDGVNVYGAFPKKGNPGLEDRHPLVSSEILNVSDYTVSDYETILTPSTSTGNRRVLGQASSYNPATDSFEDETTWDGFTIKNGYINNTSSTGTNGGAGAIIFTNAILKNCVITENTNVYEGCGRYDDFRAGGVFCNGGSLINCYVINNVLGNSISGGAAYGGGVYMLQGTAYNCVIANNKINAFYSDGAGIFIENAEFYNNTIVYNTATYNDSGRGSGGICIWESGGSSELTVYNCIVVANTGFLARGTSTDRLLIGNKDVASQQGYINCYNSIFETKSNAAATGAGITYDNSCITSTASALFEVASATLSSANYRLTDMTAANFGENTPVVNGKTINLFDYTDMDFTDRIKDCTVDAGAYERNNEDNIEPDVTTTSGKAIYYVTQNGLGNASGDSPANAACAMKLQQVLTAAGEYLKSYPATEVIVKVAGYTGASFTYHANTLANENDPQSYSYVIPYGVTLMGGYNEGTATDGSGGNWDDDKRNASEYMTVLSAIYEGTSTTQSVNGYHVVTFGEKPDGWTGEEKTTIIDGVYLEDGSATSMAGSGSDNTRGGAAIVPAWAHVRNCVIRNNSAIQGGGLYVLPGGMVSGCAIMDNTAEDEGGGIYASNSNGTVTSSNRAYLISNTIVENTASDGGGLYIEDGAAMTINSVIWGNTANSDKNISGTVNKTYADDLLTTIAAEGTSEGTITEWYPFNNCYVESIEIPGNFENTSMESDESMYFGQYFTLKPYSILINHGMVTAVQEYLINNKGVAAYDMQGNVRIDGGRSKIDVGAFAYPGGQINEDELVTRLFVSQGSKAVLEATDGDKYMGKSFYTAFTWLGDALEYINTVRSSSGTVGTEARDATFDILIASGTYKPKYRRHDAQTTTSDQRQNSFDVPYNVNIYGGFTGEENYSSHATTETAFTEIPMADGSSITGLDGGSTDIKDILAKRNRSDFNGNNIYEPWEMASQTVLDGHINLSATEQKVYHIVYSDKDETLADNVTQAVVLDGLTIMNSLTLDDPSAIADNNEVGRGGGVYSNGVDYTIANCRLLDNQAVRGGAVFLRDANLTIINSLLAGNSTIAKAANSTSELSSSGGAVFVTSISKDASLKAVNTLWANNESVGEGGAIGSDKAEDAGTSGFDTEISLMNNTFVMNKAVADAVLHHTGNANREKDKLVNTLLWGNESESSTAVTADIQYSASDKDYTVDGASVFGEGNGNNNVLLSKTNLDIDGPRFTSPTTTAGVAGHDVTSRWEPVAMSLLTDKGSGCKNGAGTDYEGGYDQAYRDWVESNLTETYQDAYMTNEAGTYSRYSGPKKEDGTNDVKRIDIGAYEYQYKNNFAEMPAIYVATVSSGSGNGTSWADATDDLHGAIIGAATATHNEAETNVYVRDGEYTWPSSYTQLGAAFPLTIGTLSENFKSVKIHGSCTGNGDTQNFGNQTIIRNNKSVTTPTYLMYITPRNKNVEISGLTFMNSDDGGTGVYVNIDNADGKLTLKNSALRHNAGDGVFMQANSGKALFVNVLFADNGTNGLNVVNGADNTTLVNTTLVNTTFANNGTDMTTGLTKVYNSTSWNNETQNMPSAGNDGLNNKVFALDGVEASVHNADIKNGPNFRDPLNTDVEQRDYRIRPNLTLLNHGVNSLYATHALGHEDVTDETAAAEAIGTEERDLYNVQRVTDGTIDIGAYEYDAILQPVIYVKSGLATVGDGTSWEKAMDDLQDATDLAGIYCDSHTGENAYVFVSKNVKTGGLNVTLPGAKIYGGMNDERYSVEGEVGDVDYRTALVENLLSQRVGLIENERDSRSQINGTLNISDASVVDGFDITGEPVITKGGMLSTSVVREAVSNGTAQDFTGILYNSLVYGQVSDLVVVNVTATSGIMPANDEDESGNNRPSVSPGATNTYINDNGSEWEYQLMETSTDIDGGTKGISRFIALAGHDRDIAGNKRERGIKNTNGQNVDNGCFETWNITAGMTEGNVVKDDDYPHGKSVVYVRHNTEGDDGAELLLTKSYTEASPFNPGFLLLEHRAGLRANDNAVSLTNFAVERNLGSDGIDMAVMPFKVDKTEGNASLSLYDAAARAAYSYKFKKDNGAWKETTYNAERTLGEAGENIMTIGWLLEGESNSKMRFYGTEYKETPGTAKNVALDKNNYSDPWPPLEGSKQFTYKENMSWNLFGSPYLCAMNYDDMQYGRVIYYYNSKDEEKGSLYGTVNTDADSDTGVTGYIPAGDAVFTQTATLKDEEKFSVAKPKEDNQKNGDAYGTGSTLAVAVAQKQSTRSGDDASADRLQLNAVPSKYSRTDFDISGDGVKWMSGDSIPQIYATSNGGRYSLLSAVNVEGSVPVGVTLPEAGMYTMSIPEYCDVSDYESVILKDAKTGRQTNLLEGGYDFTSTEGGDIEGRFSISFNRMLEDATDNGIRVWNDGRGAICVEGLERGDLITVYSADGKCVATRTATSYSARIASSVTGAVIVEVVRDGHRVTVKKTTMK